MAIALEKLSSLETAISDVVAELYEIFSAGDGLKDPAACSRMLDRYMNEVGRIGMLARGARLDGVHESCFYFYQVLQELKQRKAVLKPDELDLLEKWPFVISTCLNTPSSVEMVESLLDYFSNDLWPIELPDHVVNDVYDAYRRQSAAAADAAEPAAADESTRETSLAVVMNGSSRRLQSPQVQSGRLSDSEPRSDSQYFDADLVKALQQELTDSTDALFDDLDHVGDTDAGDAITAAFELCADRLDLMVISATEAGMDGTVAACAAFQANLRALGQRRQALSVHEAQILSNWPSRMMHYLENPADPGFIDALVDFLQTVPEAAAITDDERASLCRQLSPGKHEISPATEVPQDAATDKESQGCATVANTKTEADGVAQRVTRTAGTLPGDELAELVSLVRGELESVAEDFTAAMAPFVADGDTSARVNALNTQAEMVDRFREATESMGLIGLSCVLAHVYNNIGQLAKQGAVLDKAQQEMLQQWPQLALAYLSGLPDDWHSQPLGAYLQNGCWPIPAEEEKVAGILQQLQAPELITEKVTGEPRQTRAEAEDVSLALPEDINPQLIDSLLQELPGHTAEFNAAISHLVDGSGTLQEVDIAQRIAHTLKGSANTVGISGIANLTHHIEDILLAFTKHGCLPGRSLSNTLLAAADVLEMMSESLLGMGPSPEQEAVSTLQTILDWANRIDREGIPQQDDDTVPAAARQTANAETDAHKVASETTSMLRVPAVMVDDLLRLVGESIILTGQLQNRLSVAEEQTESLRSQHALFQQLTAELEHLVETQGLTATHTRDTLQDEFDTLELERYNELHTVTHRLVEAATDADELTTGIGGHLATLDDLLVDQRKLLKEKQELVMRTRMVPVQTALPRLQRAVRQAGRQTGKQVQLAVQGAETMIDSQVLADLIDPLTHLLRNAVDHGIEVAEQRVEMGKPETGNIELSFHRQGDHIIVDCSDDGAGLDIEAIRATAEARNMLLPDYDLGAEELTKLILLPGFSTRGETTQLSGRGIGMDAVHSRVNALKGTLHVGSEAGKGCRVELQLPLSLISVHALIVPAGDHSLAVSSRGVDQILYPGAGILQREGDTLTYRLEEHVYEAWHLETLLQMPLPSDAEQSNERPMLLVRNGNSTVCAVCVSGVSATQDLVVKQMGPFVPPLVGIEGTTILGDGSVAPLIDIPTLLGTDSHGSTAWIHAQPDRTEPSQMRPCALVVDDSLSARRSLGEFMQDLGYEVLTARDGLEAIEVMAERIPKILLVDLEMPRMNGLELAAHVRAQQSTGSLPMIMITSRSTEKHRQKAQAAGVNAYLTKPFSEDVLIDQIQAVVSEAERTFA